MTLEHKTSLKSLGYICSNSQKYIINVALTEINEVEVLKMIKTKTHIYIYIYIN